MSPAAGTIYLGGVGAGKTLTLCRRAILRALKGRRFCVISFSYPNLRDTVLFTMRKCLEQFNFVSGKDFTVNKTEMSINLRGTEIMMRSGDEPDRLRGLSISDFGIDEARQFKTRDIFDIMLGRIREQQDCSWSICSTTRGRDWVWELIEAEGLIGKLIDDNWAETKNLTVVRQSTVESAEYGFIPFSYVKQLKASYTSDFARQEIYADFVDFGGELIRGSWFQPVPAMGQLRSVCRAWDIAVTTKTSNDASAGALCGMSTDDKFVIGNIITGRWEYPDLRRKIIEAAKVDGTQVPIIIEEAGQQKSIIDDLKADPELRQHTIRAMRPRGDKMARMMPWVSRAELGGVRMVQSHWNKPFISEAESFRGDLSHKSDDQIDSISLAYQALNNMGSAAAIQLY